MVCSTPLGLPVEPRGVEDEQRVLGAHRLRRAVGGDAPPSPRAARRRGRRPGAPRRRCACTTSWRTPWSSAERLVDIGLERRAAAAARRLVGGDDQLRAAVLDARAQRLGGEAGEDDRVHRADPRAGEHRVGGLGDHRQVDHDAVALADAERLQDVGELRDLRVQLAVADVRAGRRVVALPDDRGLLAAGREMAVDAVGRDVELAVLEPVDRDVGLVEAGVLDPGVGPDPVEPLPSSRQNPSGSAIDAAYFAAYLPASIRAWETISAAGSCSSWSDMGVPLLAVFVTRPGGAVRRQAYKPAPANAKRPKAKSGGRAKPRLLDPVPSGDVGRRNGKRSDRLDGRRSAALPRGRPLAAKVRAQVRAESSSGAGVFACAGGALAAPAPPALLSRFLAGKSVDPVGSVQ